MMQAVEQTAKHSNHLIDAIISQMQATLEYGEKELKWYNRELNDAIFAQPYLKAKIIENIVQKTSRTTITKYLSELTRLGILMPKEVGNQVFYINTDLIRILEG